MSSGSGPPRSLAGDFGVAIPMVGHAGRPATHPAFLPAVRPPVIEFGELLVVLELADFLAVGVAGVLADRVEQVAAARAARIERVERPIEAQCLGAAVVGIAVDDAETGPGRVEVRIEELEVVATRGRRRWSSRRRARCPLPSRFFSSSSTDDVFAPPWRLKLMPGFSVQVSRVRTSRIDGLAVVRHRPDPCVVQVVVGAQDALGLVDQALHVGLARS